MPYYLYYLESEFHLGCEVLHAIEVGIHKLQLILRVTVVVLFWEC